MIIYPAMDLYDGGCVRLRQGSFDQITRYPGDPLEVARSFASQGARWIHAVDLNAARTGVAGNSDVMRAIAGLGVASLQVGGGMRDMASVREAAGYARRVVIGTAGVSDPGFLFGASSEFPGRIVLALDFADGKVMVSGWARESGRELMEFLRQVGDADLAGVIATDISRDGLMCGPAAETYSRMAEVSRHAIIASGGVRSIDDLETLNRTGVGGVIVGKALYEGVFPLSEALDLFGREEE